MVISSMVPVPALVQWCRALRHGLDIGLSPVRIFRQQAKSGPPAIRPLAETLAGRLEQGQSLEDALKPERHRFPLLFVELIAVGEQTGRLTETFEELERYFETVLSSRKQFLAALAWPMIMYFAAIGIVTVLIAVLGMIPGGLDGKPPIRPFGDILIGPSGAILFLLMAGLFTVGVVFAFLVVRENESLRGKLEAFALNIPGVGGCFRAFALQRFSLALHMASEAGLRADRALSLAFRATANEAYRKEAESAARKARGGKEIAPILSTCGGTLFPPEYLDAVQVGEVTGQLAEVMAKQAKHYREEAARKLKVLTMLAGGAVYAMIGIMVIVLIFKIAMVAIIDPLNDATRAVDNPDEWLRGH
jgi:type II secretory pathway component PulF